MLNGMSDSIQPSRIENLRSTEVDRQSPMGLIFVVTKICDRIACQFLTYCLVKGIYSCYMKKNVTADSVKRTVWLSGGFLQLSSYSTAVTGH